MDAEPTFFIFLECVCDYLAVIECEIKPAQIYDPLNCLRIISRARFVVLGPGQKRDGADVPTRIAVWVRIDANEEELCGLHARLLDELASRSRLHSFADFDEAPGSASSPL